MVAISTLLLVVALSLLITRVATVVLTATGMSRQSARFQAPLGVHRRRVHHQRVREVADHPLRRRVIAPLMLLGNVGIVVAASSAILGLRSGGFGAAGCAHPRTRRRPAPACLHLPQHAGRRTPHPPRSAACCDRYTDLPTRDQDSLLELPPTTRSSSWRSRRRLGAGRPLPSSTCAARG